MPVPPPNWHALLQRVQAHALAHLDGHNSRPVAASATAEQLRAALGGPLPDGPEDPVATLERLAATAPDGLLATTAARFFGFVIGGALPAAAAADMLAVAWDQNAGLFVSAPSESIAEEVAQGWLLQLLGLPRTASVGFVTGAQMANATCLAVARHHVLAAAGWDVEADGLQGAPRITVVATEERHVTIDRALRLTGLGTRMVLLPTTAQGAVDLAELPAAMAEVRGPAIVCCQVGDVNTGAIDPVAAICDAAHERGAWVHVDGAFGLWARAAPSLRDRLEGVERADSWTTDAHKWLNTPYDCGLAFTAHPASHLAATGSGHASYLEYGEGTRDQLEWTPEFSRRGRGFAVWAALRSLGQAGVAELVERCCALARRFAEQLDAADGVHVRNEVVLNQVLVGFDVPARELVAAVQRDGTCWPSPTTWRGEDLMRLSISNWQTTQDDVDASVAAILRCHAALRAG